MNQASYTKTITVVLVALSATIIILFAMFAEAFGNDRPDPNKKAPRWGSIEKAPSASMALSVGGDFVSTDLRAAAPFTYDHTTGGGAFNDGTVGELFDVTTALLGAQFTCSDVVTFLTKVEINAAPVDPVQTAEFEYSFLANSTGQAGVAISDILYVGINYGSVENGDDGTGTNPGAGSFGVDGGIDDDGGSTATLVSESLTGALFVPGSELLGTVRIDDLEAGETVILRMDVRLSCQAGSSPTGNLQGQIDNGTVVDPVLEPGVADINTGAQTINFRTVGGIAGVGEPILAISKTVTSATGTCGVDDGDLLDGHTAGEQVKYCYVVTNPGTDPLFDVELVDDNGTPSPATGDDFVVTLSGLADLDADADLGDLAAGDTARGEALITLSSEGKVVNVASGSGNDNGSPNPETLAAVDSATVNVGEPAPLPDIELMKTGTFNDEDQDTFADVGETIDYDLKITNTGNVALLNISVTDAMLGTVTCPSGNPIASLAPDSMETCTGSYTLTQVDIDAGKKDNSAMVAGADSEGTEVDDTDGHSEPLPQNPSVLIEKTATFNDENQDTFGDVGETIDYNLKVTNDGNVTLTNVSVSDPIVGTVTCPSGNNPIASLAPDSMETCTGSYTLTQDDVDAGERANTAAASGEPPSGDPVDDTGDHVEPLPQNPLIAITKEVCDSDPSVNAEAVCEEENALEVLNGSDVYYRLKVENVGNVTLHNIVLSDPNVDLAGCTVTDPLAPAAMFECIVGPIAAELSVDLETGDVTSFVNTATAFGDDPAGEVTVDSVDTAQYTGLFVGFTLGFWKNHTDLWCDAYTPETLLSDIFDTSLGGTLLDALNFRGGNKEKIVLRSATATLLTACALEQQGLIPPVGPDEIYPYSSQDVIEIVNQAIADGRRALQTLNPILDAINNGIEDKCIILGTCAVASPVSKTGTDLTQASVTQALPEKFAVGQNYPNPFNPSTTIRIELPQTVSATLTIFDVLGRRVTDLINGTLEAGIHEVRWQANDMPSGLYFYVVQAGSFMETKQMFLTK